MRLLILLLLVGLALAVPLTEKDDVEVPIHREPERSNVDHKLIDEAQIPSGNEMQIGEASNSAKEFDVIMEAMLDAMLAVFADSEDGDPAHVMPVDVPAPSSPAELQRAD